MNIFRKKRRLRPGQVGDGPEQPSAEELAAFAREEELYALGNAAALDSFGLSSALMIFRYRPIAKHLASIGKRYSMLHPDVLILLYYLACKSRGDILEIGPYIGGSTIALAEGVRDAGQERAFVTVEKGGRLEHPTLTSRDIVADLKQNLAHNRVADLVQLIVGEAVANETGEEVRRRLRPGSVELFVMDADGGVELALDFYRDLLADHCWVVIDDYFAATGPAFDKAARTKAQIDALGTTGELEGLAPFGWGTWFGRWHRSHFVRHP